MSAINAAALSAAALTILMLPDTAADATYSVDTHDILHELNVGLKQVRLLSQELLLLQLLASLLIPAAAA